MLVSVGLCVSVIVWGGAVDFAKMKMLINTSTFLSLNADTRSKLIQHSKEAFIDCRAETLRMSSFLNLQNNAKIIVPT